MARVDAASYQELEYLIERGVCSSIAECIRLLVKQVTPRLYQHEIFELLERAKAVSRAAGCERCSEVLEVARVVVLRMLSGRDPPCRLLRGLLEEVCGGER